MFSIQKFFGKDPTFFELLEAASLEVERAATLLPMIVDEQQRANAVTNLAECRKKSRQLFDTLGELIIVTFVTALEKEDIEALSVALYKIIKPLEKFSERLEISKPITGAVDFSKHIELIKAAAVSVVALVAEVKRSGNLEQVRKLTSQLTSTEAQADTLQVQLLSQLYAAADQNPLRVVLIKDLYDLLEKTIDRCRDVGTVVMHIALKNS